MSATRLPLTTRIRRRLCADPEHGPTAIETLQYETERFKSATRLLVVTGRDLYDAVHEIGDPVVARPARDICGRRTS